MNGSDFNSCSGSHVFGEEILNRVYGVCVCVRMFSLKNSNGDTAGNLIFESGVRDSVRLLM